MKRILLLSIALIMFFLSCTKDEKPVLTVSQTSISAPSAGNSTTITLVANNPWSVSGTDWCTVSPSSGQGGGEITVTITVKENTTYDARNHTLTFISKELSQSLTVSQESNYGIVLPKNTYELSSDAQQISVEVKANVTYEVSIDADWIKENGTKALTSKTYTFDIAANSSYDSRDGVITIKEKDGNNVETIKVKQAQKDVIIISSKEYNLSSKAQTLEVKLQTNVDLEVVIPDDAKSWVSHTETKALSDKTLVFNISKNEAQNERSCMVSIKIKNNDTDVVTIRITQKSFIVMAITDYIDEYGINHGKGIIIDNIVWAPVNCGYKASTSFEENYPKGKLYQWGRKYGQSRNSNKVTIMNGPVSLEEGQNPNNEGVFYLSYESPDWDWLTQSNDKLWNNGTEESPIKTDYDPCPDGWRVPTISELKDLKQNFSDYVYSPMPGRWFSGKTAYSETSPRIFLPAAGKRFIKDGSIKESMTGIYYSSSPSPYWDVSIVDFDYASIFSSGTYKGYGCSIRCVQE